MICGPYEMTSTSIECPERMEKVQSSNIHPWLDCRLRMLIFRDSRVSDRLGSQALNWVVRNLVPALVPEPDHRANSDHRLAGLIRKGLWRPVSSCRPCGIYGPSISLDERKTDHQSNRCPHAPFPRGWLRLGQIRTLCSCF